MRIPLIVLGLTLLPLATVAAQEGGKKVPVPARLAREAAEIRRQQPTTPASTSAVRGVIAVDRTRKARAAAAKPRS